jgi:glutaredoxin-related protein
MEKPDLQTQLRKIISEYTVEPTRPQIVINGPIILGADIATLTSLKLILQAFGKTQDISPPPKIKSGS